MTLPHHNYWCTPSLMVPLTFKLPAMWTWTLIKAVFWVAFWTVKGTIAGVEVLAPRIATAIEEVQRMCRDRDWKLSRLRLW